MNRSPTTGKEETNRCNPEVATPSKRGSGARKLVDYTQQRGEGETHIQEKQTYNTSSKNLKPSSMRRLHLLQPGIPSEIVLDKEKSKTLTAEREEAALGAASQQQKEEGEEMVDFLLRIPASSKRPRQPEERLRSSLDTLNNASQGSLKSILAELGGGYTKNDETKRKKRRDQSL
jgi:hypothetical protein